MVQGGYGVCFKINAELPKELSETHSYAKFVCSVAIFIGAAVLQSNILSNCKST